MAGRHAYGRSVAPLAGTGRGSPARRAYRHQGVPKDDPAASRAEELLSLLVQQRKTIALRSSRVRALTAELRECVAQAACDGVKTATMAEVSGMPAAVIRAAARARDELYPSDQDRHEHLQRIAGLAQELMTAENARAAVEQKRTQVLVLARKSRLLDDYQLACASGLKHEEIRKMTRGKAARTA